ncbi:hypothetical protein HOY80DRAFT_1040498 [Tuber brumale]|nr:hypothetical protein HOY80DRAFT_1040498 [Tuber brumale]
MTGELALNTSTWSTRADSTILCITEALERLQIASHQNIHHSKSTGMHQKTPTRPSAPKTQKRAQTTPHPNLHDSRLGGLHRGVFVRPGDSEDLSAMTFPLEATMASKALKEEFGNTVNTQMADSRVGQEQALAGDEGDGEWVVEDLYEDRSDGSAVAPMSVEMEGVEDEGWLLLVRGWNGCGSKRWELLGECEAVDEISSLRMIEVEVSVDDKVGN